MQDKRSLPQSSYAVEDAIGSDPARRQDRLTILPGTHQPALEAGALGALHVRPEIVTHHGDIRRLYRPQASHGGLKELRAGLSRHPGREARGELESGHERPGIEREPSVPQPVAVTREGKE